MYLYVYIYVMVFGVRFVVPCMRFGVRGLQGGEQPLMHMLMYVYVYNISNIHAGIGIALL